MTTPQTNLSNVAVSVPEEQLRAQIYRLLARFLANPPNRSDLDAAAAMQGDDTDFGKAIAAFSKAASSADIDEVSEEYHDLFIGLTRGELLPFASYYLTGFLNEKPLAKLRSAMSAQGVEADPKVSEPEDHIAAVLDIMAGFILGDFGLPLSLDQQKEFYDEHIRSWAPHFFRDLESAKASRLYAKLAPVGRIFLEIEETAFSMVEPTAEPKTEAKAEPLAKPMIEESN